MRKRASLPASNFGSAFDTGAVQQTHYLPIFPNNHFKLEKQNKQRAANYVCIQRNITFLPRPPIPRPPPPPLFPSLLTIKTYFFFFSLWQFFYLFILFFYKKKKAINACEDEWKGHEAMKLLIRDSKGSKGIESKSAPIALAQFAWRARMPLSVPTYDGPQQTLQVIPNQSNAVEMSRDRREGARHSAGRAVARSKFTAQGWLGILGWPSWRVLCTPL